MDFVSKRFNLTQTNQCIIIGEIGVNHNGSEELLFKLIDEGIAVGLDVIKLQRFISEEEISSHASLASYQKDGTDAGSQLEMAKALELPDELLIKAFEYCKEKEVGFLCTAFDHSSVDFLAQKLGCKTLKIPSPEITNKPLLEHMAASFDSLILSTGASYLDECERALAWIKAAGCKDLALLHCLSEYPAPLDQANLNAIPTMAKHFNLPVGYSDHTSGIIAAVVSASLGAVMVEKHYTLDKNMPGPDHKASADIKELSTLVQAVKEACMSLGDGVKKPMPAELENRPLIRKSLFCNIDCIKKDTPIERRMLASKRPWTKGAVEPADIDKICGRRIASDITYDQPILWEDIND